MTTLRVETISIAASSLGPSSPLPDLRAAPAPDAAAGPDDYHRRAHITGCLPYRVQNGFDRAVAPRPFRLAVLENDHLRATFLLELGGRLWSLLHKPTGRELLHQPRVLHFANIALCNAWFAGGVEWNLAVRGHAAHTCSPVFAAAGRTDDGDDALRIYEHDRFRELLWQIDFLLLDDAPVLLARPRVINTRDETVPMYWWSNIAVPERPGHRVVVPADHAWHYDYDRTVRRVPVPFRDGTDVSYPTNSLAAHDYFYDVPAGCRPWIASLDPAGCGLVHASTSRLGGRKLFVWGTGPGGQRWQRQLGADADAGYIELQAGLAATQGQYLPIGPREQWSWLEAYAPLAADAAIVHGPDFHAAGENVQAQLDNMLPQERLESLLAETAALAERPPRRVLQRGSDYGALEQLRRQTADDEPVAPAAMDFGQVDPDGAFGPWLALLTAGDLPETPPDEPPGEFITHPAWREMLTRSLADHHGRDATAQLHLGVMAFRDGDLDAAEQAWHASLTASPSAWALRNLAVLAGQRGLADEAADLYLQATRLAGDLLPLAIEAGGALLAAGRLDDLDDWLATLDPAVLAAGRMRLLVAWAACRRGDLDEAEALLDRVDLADVREGETSLTDLWFAIQARRAADADGVEVDDALTERIRQTLTPPKHIDFRMS